MPEMRYDQLQVLIVDDFDSFRSMLFNMLQELGVHNISVAASDQEALRLCSVNTYDIILCDQNLGQGKSGQQILEMLRHTPNLNSDSLFALVSAESNKSIIMAAFEYEPDDYLTKPITSHTLEQRLNRLLAQRLALAPIYQALKESNSHRAIELCRNEIKSDNRYGNYCQKLLGRLLIASEQFDEAEKLYRAILEGRQLDWAMLGMANVKNYQGNTLSAQQWLEEIIQFNPLCLKAYDLLANILGERGDNVAQQQLLQQALEISPLAILRQQALGAAALKNNDVVIAVGAFRKAVKLGENSCHDNVGVHVNFVHSTIRLLNMDKAMAKPIFRDAHKSVVELPLRFGKNADNKVNSYSLESQLQFSAGEENKSKEAMLAAQHLIDKNLQDVSLSTKVEWVKTLRLHGKHIEAEKVIAELLAACSNNDDELQKIDSLLEEPYSEKNKLLVAKANQEGIAHFEAKNFSRAIEAFGSASQRFPQHIGLRLNLIQALIELFKLHPKDLKSLQVAQNALSYVAQHIASSHMQYGRFQQLEMSLKLCESRRN